MKENIYRVDNADNIITPALVYYPDIIEKNTTRIIEIAGSTERLWPHVKTYKSADMVSYLVSMGIHRFKCATIAECEMVAMAGGTDIVLAYPLVGPNISRFVTLTNKYPECKFYAIGDDYNQVKLLSDAAKRSGVVVDFLIDINLGMNRTGIKPEDAPDFKEKVEKLAGIRFVGLHCYDGNHTSDFSKRMGEAQKMQIAVDKAKAETGCSLVIIGGTPTFPCFARLTDYYLSPGTCFINDYGYRTNFPDLDFTPASSLLSRVVSHPENDTFTIDLGYKAIASDPEGLRGKIVGIDATPLFQSEEHWTFRMNEGKRPEIGEVVYVIPTHICPTTALYPEILIARNGMISNSWPVTARNRKITI